ncbi:hypothetical protein L1887_30200 [Cichorium endivia]|nr:hypothetical protein L1887_30200 [Cichorium endivia]
MAGIEWITSSGATSYLKKQRPVEVSNRERSENPVMAAMIHESVLADGGGLRMKMKNYGDTAAGGVGKKSGRTEACRSAIVAGRWTW